MASPSPARMRAEANVPLAKGLEANLAIRFDHYSDMGSTTNPKNLAGSYGGFKGWRLSAGIKNLFDRNPPFSNQRFTGEGPVGYDPMYANPIGRVYWAAVAYSFR